MKIIYVMGIDGAGKTTLSKRFVARNSSTYKLKYLYLQYFPLILRPIKYMIKKTIMKGHNEFGNYTEYAKQKINLSKRRRIFARIYCYIWYFDYFIQIIPKLIYNSLIRSGNVFIIDRYYIDSVIHTSFILGLDEKEILDETIFLENFFYKANHHVFLDVFENIAFQRKEDIQSEQYLRERKERYLLLSRYYNFIFIDANKGIDTVYKVFDEILSSLLNKF